MKRPEPNLWMVLVICPVRSITRRHCTGALQYRVELHRRLQGAALFEIADLRALGATLVSSLRSWCVRPSDPSCNWASEVEIAFLEFELDSRDRLYRQWDNVEAYGIATLLVQAGKSER